jgi:hypothetical protein
LERKRQREEMGRKRLRGRDRGEETDIKSQRLET